MALELTQLFFGAMIVGFSGALVPGPMFTLVVTKVAQKGFWASFFIVIGHAIAELAILVIFLFGFINYLKNEIVIKIIGILGGIGLLYMAYDMISSSIRNKIKINLDLKEKEKLGSGRSNFFTLTQGFLISLVNPYWYIWWVTVGAAFLLKSTSFGYLGNFTFYSGHISSDFIWYLFIGFILSKGKKIINMKVYRILFLICGLFLVYLGIKFIIDFTIR
ncbi:MAG: LysE family transporter [Actinomycetota bacterium]|nr:LysE family transporter [Actinomycetota bacterium]